MAVARTVLIVGLMVAGAGAARLTCSSYWFDTWEVRHVPAPAGLEVPFEESVLVQDDELEARAREGTAAAWRLVMVGGSVSVAAAVGLWLARKRARERCPRGGVAGSS